MSDTAANRAFNWFTPWRFGILLGILIFASFPQVLLGLQTFVARDYGFFAYPLAHFQKECFWHGRIPFWDPYNNCGVPFLAQWNTMPLYPPALIYLLLPLTWSLSFFCLLHLWFGGLGMYFLARKWTGNELSAAFAGTAFSFSGLTLNLLMWPSHTATWSWMPWVVLLVESAWRRGGRGIFIAAMAGAIQMLAGGPEIIFFTWLVLLALWVQQLVSNDFPRRRFWCFPAVVVLVFALSAAQLLPFLHLAAHSQRQSGYADFRWSMPGRGWANFLLPMAFGSVHGEGIFFQTGQYWTSSYYLGIGTLWLALLAVWRVRDRRVYLLAGFAVAAVIFALGGNTPIFPALRRVFPEFGFVTYPVKYLLLVAFVAPLLAAMSLSRLPQRIGQKQIAAVGVALLFLLAFVLYWACRNPVETGNIHALVLNGVFRAGFLLLAWAALFVLAGSPEANVFKVAPLILIVAAWLDVLTHEPPQNPTVTPEVYQLNIAREKLAMDPQPELGRSRAMVSPRAFMEFIQMALRDPKNNYLAKRLGYCGDCNLLDGVPKVDGFFSLTTRENNDLFSLMYGATNSFPRLEDFLGVSQITASDEIYHWRSRHTFLPLVTAGQEPVFLNDAQALGALAQSNFDGSKTVFLPPEAQSAVASRRPGDARVVTSHFGMNTVEIDVAAKSSSLVVIAQTYYDEWRAFVDGTRVRILRANVGFQAVEVPPGKHSIKLIYHDSAFYAGAILSIIGWLVCLLGGLIFRQSGPKNIGRTPA